MALIERIWAGDFDEKPKGLSGLEFQARREGA